MTKQLAIMSEPHFGMRDMDYPAFWFDVRFGESLSRGALIILSIHRMTEVVMKANIRDVSDLRNHSCQVDVSDDGTVSFMKVVRP